MTSRDGVQWDRTFREAWMRPGPDPRNWSHRSNMPGTGIIETAPGEWSLYISEHYGWPTNRLRRLTVRGGYKRVFEYSGDSLKHLSLSDRATIATYTINHHPWIPGFDPPYVVAIVEIEEQPSLRLMTNIVDCKPDEVAIDMRVEVVFEDAGEDDVFLPLFRPRRDAAA